MSDTPAAEKKTLSVVVPCYNEEDNVPKLLAEFYPVLEGLQERYAIEVVFVDDGSRDQTYERLKDAFNPLQKSEMSFTFLQHEVNRGLGAAVRTGFSGVHGDLVVTTDSDGTYKFATIPAILDYLTPGTDIVTASPYHPAGEVVGVPRYRLILSQGAPFLYRVLVSWKIHTYTCLFRAYRREVIDTTPFDSNGFLAGTELMVKAMLKGYRVAEYPATLYSRMYGVSKAKLVRTIRAHLGFQWQIVLHRLHIKSLV
jgi:dolichol-phosphate mannosyltransferase